MTFSYTGKFNGLTSKERGTLIKELEEYLPPGYRFGGYDNFNYGDNELEISGWYDDQDGYSCLRHSQRNYLDT